MKIEKIKQKMIEWHDFYGGDLLNWEGIEKAKTKKDLAKIFNEHENFLEMQNLDALSHIKNFKKELGLSYI